jgi:hypothetical protein
MDIGVCRIVAPSGGRVRTPWMAIWPPAPVRFSTTTLRP